MTSMDSSGAVSMPPRSSAGTPRRSTGRRSPARDTGQTFELAGPTQRDARRQFHQLRHRPLQVGHHATEVAAGGVDVDAGSFPSDHLTAQWVVAGLLLLDRRKRTWGIVIGPLGLLMAWARIYPGVHYPSDIVGALAMGVLATMVGWWFNHRVAMNIPNSAVSERAPRVICPLRRALGQFGTHAMRVDDQRYRGMPRHRELLTGLPFVGNHEGCPQDLQSRTNRR